MKKRVIFDVGHPAQVHNFKHIYWDLIKNGGEALFTAKDKEVTINLLESYTLPYVIIGKSTKSMLSKLINIPLSFFKFFKILGSYKPDIVVCRFSMHSTWCSFIMRIPVIGLADTEHTKLSDLLTVRYADTKLTSESYLKDLGRNHFRFNSNIEMFYLHPNRFQTTSSKIFEILNLKFNSNYVVVRFVSWSAHHDVGERGFNENQKIKLIDILRKKYSVFITSEGPLSEDLKKYKININPDLMHEVLAFASLYVGEGASMASESACVGTPAIYVNTLTAGSIIELQKNDLLIHYSKADDCINYLESNIDKLNKQEFIIKKNEFISHKIDPTAFLVWFIENFPESKKIIKENPDYQYNFK